MEMSGVSQTHGSLVCGQAPSSTELPMTTSQRRHPRLRRHRDQASLRLPKALACTQHWTHTLPIRLRTIFCIYTPYLG